jgi:hypothetical protein
VCVGWKFADIHVNHGFQDGSLSRHWLWVPYDCYYHMYTREDMLECTAKENINWIHTMGDSQEREFVASMKTVNNDTGSATKFENVDFRMDGSPNNLRVTWQFYVESFLWHDGFSHPRTFATDQKIFDHFNIRPSEVERIECGVETRSILFSVPELCLCLCPCLCLVSCFRLRVLR